MAFVIAVDRGRYTCRVDGAEVTAMKARELGRRSLAVGDEVALVGDISGAEGALARVVRVQPRRTALRRTPDDADPVERVVVANADQLLIVASLTDPPPRPGLIDRCLVAAYDAGIVPLLCLTKADLAPPDPIRDLYGALELPIIVTRRDDDLFEPAALSAVAHRLTDRVTVLIGHSGVGKSTLVNALVPAAQRHTGAVNAVTGRGRHTSSSIVALPLAGGGWVVDTPGIRSFGLGHVETDRVVRAFPDVAAGTAACPRGCTHLEPDCALDAWVAAGNAPPERLASLRRLLEARRAPGSAA